MTEKIKKHIITAEAHQQKLKKDFRFRREMIKRAKLDLKNSEDAKIIIQTVAQLTQEELEYEISEIVSIALSSVFDDPYEFNISFVQKRGKTEAEIKFLKNGNEYDILTATGGGVVDIASFALRIALWNLNRTSNTIILDEPFKHLSNNLQSRASKMIKELSSKLNIQFIMVTHNTDLIECSDKVFNVKQIKGVSQVI